MSTEPDIDNINLRLGDIVRINAPLDETIHDKTYYIKYIDSQLIELIDETCEKKLLYIENGRLLNESIKSIIILSRSKELGYARQNNLIVGIWINIYFK